MELLQVDSSNIQAVSYDEAASTLQVHFHNSRKYKYSKVPKWVFEDFLKAPSKGRFFAHVIKDGFECERVP